MKEFQVVIDTEEYSGNFEREMVAYITSRIGECGVGKEPASIASDELTTEEKEWFDSNMKEVSDDHGCFRPAYMVSTPGRGNNGHGKLSRKVSDPTPEQSKNTKYRAYMSVGMTFGCVPPPHILNLILKRAKDYCAIPVSRININPITFTCMRVIKAETLETEFLRCV